MRVCVALCTTVAHNTARNKPDNFPSYPPDNHQSLLRLCLFEGRGVSLSGNGVAHVNETTLRARRVNKWAIVSRVHRLGILYRATQADSAWPSLRG